MLVCVWCALTLVVGLMGRCGSLGGVVGLAAAGVCSGAWLSHPGAILGSSIGREAAGVVILSWGPALLAIVHLVGAPLSAARHRSILRATVAGVGVGIALCGLAPALCSSIAASGPALAALTAVLLIAAGFWRGREAGDPDTWHPGWLPLGLLALAQAPLMLPETALASPGIAAGVLVATGYATILARGLALVARRTRTRFVTAISRPVLLICLPLVAWLACAMVLDAMDHEASIRGRAALDLRREPADEHEELRHLWGSIGESAAASVLIPIGVYVGLLQVRRRSASLLALADRAQEIQRGSRELAYGGESRDETGTVIRMFNVILDALREGEEEMSQVRSLPGDLIEGMPFGIVIADSRGVIRRANQSALRLLGVDREEDLLGASQLGPCGVPDYELAPQCRAWGGRSVREEMLIAADGTAVPVLRTVLPVRFGAEPLILNAYVDLTDQKQALDDLEGRMMALEHSALERVAEVARVRDDLARTIETASAAIVGTDSEGLIDEWNTMATRVMGHPREAAIGSPLVDLLLPAEERERARSALETALGGGAVHDFECSVHTPDGPTACLLLTWNPRRDAAGTVVGVLVVGQDITERKRAEGALVEERTVLEREVEARTRELRESLARLEESSRQVAEAHHHRSRFLASMSHELRTPLNGILGFTELLRGGFFGPLTDQQAEYVSQIDQNGKRLLRLVNDLLAIARADSGPLPDQEAGAPMAAGDVGPGASPAGAKVLVVDDDASNLVLVSEMLAVGGFASLQVETGDEAILLATRERPAVILLDLELVGTSGVEVCRVLRQDPGLADTPILALTGHDEGSVRSECEEAGFTGFLVKPVDLSTLLETVARYAGG